MLANEEADKGGTSQVLGPRDIYALFGLSETEIAIIAGGIKKRHYYYASPLGRRQFELGLGPIALAFVGVSSKNGRGPRPAARSRARPGLALALARGKGGSP